MLPRPGGGLSRIRPYGHSIVDGKVRYWSASLLQSADATTGEGCLRKMWYERILGKRGPETKAQGIGKDVHSQIEVYEKTGVDALGTLAARGKHMIPEPGPDLMVEWDIVVHPDVEMVARDYEMEGRQDKADKIRASVRLEDAPLKLLDIPVFGYIDLAHFRGTNQGASEFEDAVDPPNTGEVLDWKTTKDTRYIKSKLEVSRTVQMTLYSKWLLAVRPTLEHVRLSHGYFVTQGSAAPRKVSMRVLPETIHNQWEHVERVGRSILDVVGIAKADDVPANRDACGAYGGCPHKSYCSAGAQDGLRKFFGAAGAARIAAQAQSRGSGKMTTGTGKKLGLLGKNKAPSEEELRLENLRLEKEELQARWPLLKEQWEEFASKGRGTPPLYGDFAKVVSVLTGAELVDGNLVGSGEFESTGPFGDPELMDALLAEVNETVPEIKDTRPIPQIVEEADEAPTTPSPPKKRGRPMGSKNVKKDAENLVSDVKTEEVKFVIPETSCQDVQPIEVVTVGIKDSVVEVKEALSTFSVTAATPVLFSGAQVNNMRATEIRDGVRYNVEFGPLGAVSRTRAVDQDFLEEIITEGVMEDPAFREKVAVATRARAHTEDVRLTKEELALVKKGPPLFFYVDCTPSCPSVSYWPVVHKVLAEMAVEAELPDVRLADAKHDLGFGRWEIALGLCLQMETLAPGHYTLDTTSSPTSRVVVEAMRTVVERLGGTFVRSVK